MQAMLNALDHGTSLVLFPEGTRSANRLQAFKIGAFHAAFRSGRPVVPVAIAGTERILPRHRRLLRRADVVITISRRRFILGLMLGMRPSCANTPQRR